MTPNPPVGLQGRVAALRRHPVKGFTPEPLDAVTLEAGAPFPADRLYAVENGPSGFDPDAPAHVSKMRFTVLAPIPAVARIRTRFDAETHGLRAEAEGAPPFACDLRRADAREALAAWLTVAIDRFEPEARNGPLRVLPGNGWRFFDDQAGAVSVLNLASVRDLGARMGRALDPDRFRANVWVEGWPAWAETGLERGARLRLGAAELELVKPIRRCVATHVDPHTGERDAEVVAALMREYGHADCGLYLRVTDGGRVAPGDPVRTSAVIPDGEADPGPSFRDPAAGSRLSAALRPG